MLSEHLERFRSSNAHTSPFPQTNRPLRSLGQVNNMLRNISTTKLPNSTNLPSEKLTNLVQQIQLAVQSGHLNAQVTSS